MYESLKLNCYLNLGIFPQRLKTYFRGWGGKVNKRTRGTDIVRSTSSLQQQREKQTNTIKQAQNEQRASRIGNSFPKRWVLCYPKLTEYIINPVSILYKSIAGRYRPVRVAYGPITARYRIVKNASWELT